MIVTMEYSALIYLSKKYDSQNTQERIVKELLGIGVGICLINGIFLKWKWKNYSKFIPRVPLTKC